MGVGALVLGILAIIFAIIPGLGWIGIILGAIGIVLGAIAKKQEPTGIAKGGLIVSIIGTALAAVLYISCVICVKSAADQMGGDLDKFSKEFKKELEKELKKKQK